MPRVFFSLIAILLFGAATASAQTESAVAGKSERISSGSVFGLVHFGDLVRIEVVGSPEYDWRGSLNPEGFFSNYAAPIDPVYALCKSPEALSREISSALSRLVKDPQVTVTIVDRSRRPLVIAFGAVRTPQRFQLRRGVSLRELIVLSGGLTENASGDIQIYRPKRVSCSGSEGTGSAASGERGEKTQSEFIDVSVSDLVSGRQGSDIEIGSGDVVTVLEAPPIYIVGGVANPGPFAKRSEVTLSRAVATAGGLTKDADAGRVRIFRRSGEGSGSVIDADLLRIKAGTAEDIALSAFDVVEVAQRGRKRSDSPPFVRTDADRPNVPAGLPLRIVD